MVVLSACSSGGTAPRSLPPLSTTPAANASTAPPTSKAAELAAVKAVVRRYYALANHLRISMNAAPLSQLMTADCTCREQIRAIETAAAQGRHYIDHAILRSITPELDGPTAADVLVEFDAGPGGLVDSAGRAITSVSARAGIRRFFHLVLISGHWLISEIQS